MSWEVKQEKVYDRNDDLIPVWHVKNGTKCFTTHSPTDADWLLTILTKADEQAEGFSFGPSAHDTWGSILPYSMEALTSGDWCIDFTEEKDPAASIQKFLEWCDVVGLKWADGSRTTEQWIKLTNARYMFSRPEWKGRLTWDDVKRRHADITIPFSALLPPKETT